jgi:hypothetical protein
MSRKIWVVLSLAVGLTCILSAEDKTRGPAADEEKVWKQKQAYWEYVKALNVPDTRVCGMRILWVGLRRRPRRCTKIILPTGWRKTARRRTRCNATNWNTQGSRKWAM